MTEQLHPGVFVEETSFRAREIEGVPTSTFGMAGLTRYGPSPYIVTPPDWATPLVMAPSPTLVTGFAQFERIFGGLGDVGDPSLPDRVNYVAHAAQAFFANGGERLYVSRVFPFSGDAATLPNDFAALPVGDPPVGTVRSRWPGTAGNELRVSVRFQRGANILLPDAAGGPAVLTGVQPGAAVEVFSTPDDLPAEVPPVAPVAANLRIVAEDAQGTLGYREADGSITAPVADSGVAHLTLTVDVAWGQRVDSYPGLELDAAHPYALATVLRADDPSDEPALVWFDTGTNPPAPIEPADLVAALLTIPPGGAFLSGAGEGRPVTPADLAGSPTDPDGRGGAATGLAALAEVDEVAIVALPDAVRFEGDQLEAAANHLIAHCEAPGAYRVALVDPPRDCSLADLRTFRASFDSGRAAIYYPWVTVLDSTAVAEPDAPPATVQLPPSGFVAGIYARIDGSKGVHKAPANAVVRGGVGLQQAITSNQQSQLTTQGINALRFFEGRGNRVWGARTMSSDPEWRYVSVRRLFLYLEHSIDRATQWAVFEPNDERLWASIRRSVEDFLTTVWREGALPGSTPDEAFFVRCDRTTMTQDDLDTGRLVCLIGVAPTRPAEFVIIRIGQWTADAQPH